MKNIVIIGATSVIAENVARIYAKQGHNLYLVARNEEHLNGMAYDLSLRGANAVHVECLDVNQFDKHDGVLDNAFAEFKTVDLLLIAHGTLPDQKACEKDVAVLLQELNTNAISTVAMLNQAANLFETQKSGIIAVISSVAGDRGRQSNYVYGAAKGMVSIFLQGLRNRLYPANVNVLDIKPGFVDTPMTAHFPKNFMWAKPSDVAQSIVKGINKKKHTIYTPSFWRLIMFIIRQIPESIFIRLKL